MLKNPALIFPILRRSFIGQIFLTPLSKIAVLHRGLRGAVYGTGCLNHENTEE